MNAPSIVSSSDIPAANRIGRHRIAYHGNPPAAAPPASTSSETSVAVALVIGSIELLGVLDVIPDIDLNLVGYLVVGLFVLTWALALGVWRYGRIEERWSAGVRRP